MKSLNDLRREYGTDKEFVEAVKSDVIDVLKANTNLDVIKDIVDIIFKDPVEREIDDHLKEVGKLFLESQNKLLEIRKIFEKELVGALIDSNELNKIADRLIRKLFRY